MANFQIDEITFQLNPATNNYIFSGICNKWGNDNGQTVQGTITVFDNIKFNVYGLNSDEKTLLTCVSEINFSFFDMASTNLLDFHFYNTPITFEKKGGIVIKNTNYPPPAIGTGLLPLPFEQFIDRFNVTYVKFERDDLNGNFIMTIKVKPDNRAEEYSLDTTEFHQHISYINTQYSDIHLLKVKEWPSNSGLGTASLNYPPYNIPVKIDASHFPFGFPITIQHVGEGWDPGINRKILCVYIN